MGMSHTRFGEWQEAEQSFHRAIELNPGDALPYRHFAFFVLFPMGRIHEALEQFNKALKLDPLGPNVHYETALALMAARRPKEAEAHCEKVSAEWVQKNGCLLMVRLYQGRVDEVMAASQSGTYTFSHSVSEPVVIACAYARAGRRADAEQLAAAIPDPIDQARVFAFLGDTERTIQALERGIPQGPGRMGRAIENPEFSSLRADPRLNSIRKKVGLPE
jgi:tetratricopeptide (TPR) repeat protein